MAKQCCVCERNIGFLDGFKILDKDKYACESCYGLIDDYIAKLWDAESVEQLDQIRAQAETVIDSKASGLKNSRILRDYLNSKIVEKTSFIEKNEAAKEKAAKEEEFVGLDEEDLYKNLSGKLMLSTAGMLEGFKVKKQLGVVFGETVFKPSAGLQLASSVGDAFRAFAISAKEMKGQVSIIEEARKFAYIKMMKSALERGANAIIAIDSDNTIGDNICYLSLYGTAVYVEPVE